MRHISIASLVLLGSLAPSCSQSDPQLGTGPRSSASDPRVVDSAARDRVEQPKPAITSSASSSPVEPAAAAPSVSATAAALRPLPGAPDVALIRELASGQRAMSEVLDASLGLAVIESSNGGADAPIPPPRKMCDSEAAEHARKRLVEIVEHDQRSTADGGGPSLSCGGLHCAKAPRMEYDLAIHVGFALEGGRLKLVSFDSVDVLLRDEASVQRDLNDNQRTLARLASRRCPKP